MPSVENATSVIRVKEIDVHVFILKEEEWDNDTIADSVLVRSREKYHCPLYQRMSFLSYQSPSCALCHASSIALPFYLEGCKGFQKLF